VLRLLAAAEGNHSLFAPSFAWLAKRTACERTEKFRPAKAGEFPYGTYQTLASPMWLGA